VLEKDWAARPGIGLDRQKHVRHRPQAALSFSWVSSSRH
jgi:hypothetical protein